MRCIVYCKFEIFATIIFSRNFADAEFHKNKTLAKWLKNVLPLLM